MAPKKRKGKKGKKGRKGKKGKKKREKKVPHPPPLHILTDLYNQLMEKTRHLNEMRIMARNKRLEAWFMTREMSDLKGDNQIYKDHLNENIDEIHELILKISEEIDKEKASIQKEIDRLMAQLNKKHLQILKQTETVEEELAKVKADLLEFEPLMAKLAKMLARLEQLKKEIEAAELEADIKTRHLKNQYLMERAKLHNHLEKQLFDLIEQIRSYIMPILWHHLRRTQATSTCTRWQLAKADAKNIRLGEIRDDLMLKRKLLTIEKSYIGVDWAFYKLAEVQAERRARKKQLLQVAKTTEVQEPPTELANAFNIYLKKRLTAFQEARRREARNRQLDIKPSLRFSSEAMLKEGEFFEEEDDDEEDDIDDDDWEDVDEGEGGEGWENPFARKRKKRKRRRRPMYHDGDEDDDDDQYDSDSSSSGASSGSTRKSSVDSRRNTRPSRPSATPNPS